MPKGPPLNQWGLYRVQRRSKLESPLCVMPSRGGIYGAYYGSELRRVVTIPPFLLIQLIWMTRLSEVHEGTPKLEHHSADAVSFMVLPSITSSPQNKRLIQV